MEKRTILVVEDDEPVRQAIRDVLSPDYHILEASDYAGVLDHRTRPIALAIIDYALPGRSGFDVLEALRETDAGLPAIMITGYGSENLAISACEARLVDYIKKPLRLAYLKCRISEILDGVPCDEYSGYTGKREEFILDFVCSYMETHHMEEDLLDDVLSMAHMDKYKFFRTFRKRFGMTYTFYLNTIRAENAAHLIKNFDLRIAEIAHHAGYRSVTYFERVFRARYGVSPLEYRRKIKEMGKMPPMD